MPDETELPEQAERTVQELFGAVPPDEAQKVCSSCGFLALRDSDTAEPVEALAGYRERPSTRMSGRRFLPLCVKHRRNFAQAHQWQLKMFNDTAYLGKIQAAFDEFATSEDALRALAMRVVIWSPFECDQWAPYTPGTGPKETLTLEREERRDQEMREREDRRDRLTSERHAEQMRELKANHWRELIVFGGVIGAATILAAILEGAISRGWEPGWWPF